MPSFAKDILCFLKENPSGVANERGVLLLVEHEKLLLCLQGSILYCRGRQGEV
jgi:hypothetical protein